MRFGVLGTGVVGRTLAAKLSELGNPVMLGTRSVEESLARSEPDRFGNPPLKTWLEAYPDINLGSYAQAAEHGELLFNATSGQGSLEALKAAGEVNLNGKVLVDIANPLGFSQGTPILTVSNTDSLGEQIQRQFPQVKVVKSLNTINAAVMVDPAQVAGGDHVIFVCGNDAEAKTQVISILKDSFGWKEVLDLGDISASRALEMYLPLWLRMRGVLQTSLFNIKIVR